jgi:hypothetical protein
LAPAAPSGGRRLNPLQSIASFWQAVGWMAAVVIIAAAVALIVWRNRRRRQRLTAHAAPPPPRKPNGEDRR